jgi:hypothetical protein
MTEKWEPLVLCKLQRGLSAAKLWCEHWNININEGSSQAIYSPRRFRISICVLQLNARNIPFVNEVKYLGVNLVRRMTETPYRKDCSQGPDHIHKNLLPIQQ